MTRSEVQEGTGSEQGRAAERDTLQGVEGGMLRTLGTGPKMPQKQRKCINDSTLAPDSSV